MKKKQKQCISIGVIFILMFIMSLFGNEFAIRNMGLFLWLSFVIFFFGFSDEMDKVMYTLFIFGAFSILFVIIFAWFFNIQLPFGINITDNSIIALFTIVLAGATIVNIFIYNRSLSLSRLSTIDVWLENNFYVNVSNMGDFGIKDISVEMEIIERPPKKSSFKEKFRINLINRVKDLLDTEEKKISFIASHGNKRKDFFDYASKRLNLKKKSDKYNNFWVEFKKNEKERDVFIKLSINYFTDTLSKSPRPFIKIFKIIFKEKKLIEVEEID